MRIAVCISGKPRDYGASLPGNLASMKSALPSADFFMGIWEDSLSDFTRLLPNETCKLYKEPEVSYHPYLEVKLENPPSDYMANKRTFIANVDNVQATTAHQTKQIIAHAYMVDDLQEEYDIVVRTRYDAYVSRKADLIHYAKTAYNEQVPVGFAFLGGKNFDNANETKRPNFLFDHMIIHRADMFDTNHVYALDKSQMLMPAEFGWHQVFGTDRHINVCGWVNSTRSLTKDQLKY